MLSLFSLVILARGFFGVATNDLTISISSSLESKPLSAVTPLTYGINLGHKNSADTSWLAFIKYLGVKAARSFGVGGLASTSLSLPTKGIGASVNGLTESYGSSLSGVVVCLNYN